MRIIISQSNVAMRDAELRLRASRVIPGGMWGHMNTARLPQGYPQFFERAKGCRLWDVDGNEYVDMMCAFGPIVLGYGDDDVDAAATRQRERGDTMTGPAACQVELAELWVATLPHADWAMFGKNGSDATTACVTIARAGTGRKKVLAARGSYHGSAPWCSPSHVGIPAEDRAHVLLFDYNDPESLERAVGEAKGDLAAVIVTPFRHDIRRDQEMPTSAFAAAVRSLCDREDAALILDDVRAGFRLHMGGSWEPLGIRPDLSAWSKALGNGYPIAAITGGERFRRAAQSIYLTGSFWCEASPMAAAIATIEKLKAVSGIASMEASGRRLREGLAEQAARYGVGIRQTGPAQMPMILFDGDVDFAIGNRFVVESLKRGAYLHPWHNMFLSAAHSSSDIDRVLEATDGALKAISRERL